jgi:hypothetical protein
MKKMIKRSRKEMKTGTVNEVFIDSYEDYCVDFFVDYDRLNPVTSD